MNLKSKLSGAFAALVLLTGLQSILAVGPFAHAFAQQDEVGEVTFQIGQASIERAGKGVPATRGAKVQVGDVLKTAEGGHLHIRFVDGALVSLRPASHLQVQAYQFNAERPADSTVKFTLVVGSVRAISGKAAESAKERFRLNTPFVAIGVRGTDFVTRVDANRVAAVVNQGAIVFAPLDAICRADALGPCAGDRARLITADMRALVEFANNQLAPIVRPLDAAAGKELIVPVSPEETSNTLKRSRNELDAQSKSVDKIEAQVVPAASVPLVWGRWTNMAVYGDIEIKHFLEAIKDRKGTIGTENFSLFRYESSPLRFATNAGVHSFRLEQSAANFIPVNSQVALPASVLRGSLTVDFGARTFGSYLDLLSSTGVRGNLLGIGSVDERGIFLMDAADARVRGAVGRNADSAGLTFERTVQDAGKFHGVTIWGK